MKKLLRLIPLLFFFTGCDKIIECEPSSVCKNIDLEILDSNNHNIFNSQYSIDSLIILDKNFDTVTTTTNVYNTSNRIKFPILSCDSFELNVTTTNSFYLHLNSLEIDTINCEFKVVNVPNGCGGREYEFLRIFYRNKEYNVTLYQTIYR